MLEYGKKPLWMWLSQLSLDAPLVALVWQDFVARCYAAPLLMPARIVLGLTVWAIYLADRLIDTRQFLDGATAVRYWFYRRARPYAKAVLAVVILADVAVSLFWLRPALILVGMFALAAVLFYFAIFVVARVNNRWKRVSASLLFVAGVFLVAWNRSASPWLGLWWPAATFFALCLANLLLIESWGRKAPPRIWIGMTILAGLCCLGGGGPWNWAVALSAAGLACLNLFPRGFNESVRRVAADAVLLTPLLFR